MFQLPKMNKKKSKNTKILTFDFQCGDEWFFFKYGGVVQVVIIHKDV